MMKINSTRMHDVLVHDMIYGTIFVVAIIRLKIQRDYFIACYISFSVIFFIALQ